MIKSTDILDIARRRSDMEEISNRWVRAVRNEGPAVGRSAVDRAADFLTRKAVEPAHRIHRAMEGYRPTSRIAWARSSEDPLGIYTYALQPSWPAAQATPLPWFPSVAVTNTIPESRPRTGSD